MLEDWPSPPCQLFHLMGPICSPQLQSGNHAVLAKFLSNLHVVAAYLETGLVSDLLEAHVLYGEISHGCFFCVVGYPAQG